MGFVSLDVQYVDGTKIEAASNRYSFVWRGSVEKNKARLEVKIDSVLKTIESVMTDEQCQVDQDKFPETIDSKLLEEKIRLLNVNRTKLNKKQQKQVKNLEQDALPRLKKYEQQLDVLGDRNSFSKTDTDATFMRMKEDHMKNG